MEAALKAGRYQIEKQIVTGGMGVVYRAIDTRLNCRVALKEIRPELLNDPQYRKRLAQEARAAAAISHPGIARALDYVDDGKETFVVYEYVEGVTLREHMGKGQLPLPQLLDFAIQTADALAAAHDQGFIHRDLKPENIMLASRPDGAMQIKILDFGLTKRFWAEGANHGKTEDAPTAITTTHATIGTLDYMSPEQLRAEALDFRTDIYSLGLVIYEMAAGVNPFRGGDPSSTIAHILTQEVPSLSALNSIAPAELDHVARKCLRKKREERYQSVRELVTDLKHLRDSLASGGSRAEVPLRSDQMQTPLTISRGLARALFLISQVGYLVMYGVAVRFLPRHVERLELFGASPAVLALIVLVVLLLGASVRVYFLSAVGFDYIDSGRLYQRIFPVVLALDLAWSAMPLLLFKELEWVSLLCVVGLAFLPFSHRALIYTAYAPRGGKTSGVRASITV